MGNGCYAGMRAAYLLAQVRRASWYFVWVGEQTCSSRIAHPPLLPSSLTFSSTHSVLFAVLATKTRELLGLTVT